MVLASIRQPTFSAVFEQIVGCSRTRTSRKVAFIIGHTRLPGSIFARGIMRFFSIANCLGGSPGDEEANESVRNMKPPPFPNVIAIFSIRNHFFTRTLGRMNLGRLIRQTLELDSEDPRDRLYGLLGLCHPDERSHPSLRVDYTESAEHLGLRVSRYLLSHGAPFVLYTSIGCYSVLSSPSWILDLRVRRDITWDSFVEPDGSCPLNSSALGSLLAPRLNMLSDLCSPMPQNY